MKFHIYMNFLSSGLVTSRDFIRDKRSSLMRFSDSSRIPGDPRTRSRVSWSMGNSGRCLVLECVTRNGIFANVGKPEWSTGCQAVLGSPGRCSSGHAARRSRCSPCGPDGAWMPGPSQARSWHGSPPRIGPSPTQAATSDPLAYCLLPEPSSLRAGLGTPVLVPADQERIKEAGKARRRETSHLNLRNIVTLKICAFLCFEHIFTSLLFPLKNISSIKVDNITISVLLLFHFISAINLR